MRPARPDGHLALPLRAAQTRFSLPATYKSGPGCVCAEDTCVCVPCSARRPLRDLPRVPPSHYPATGATQTDGWSEKERGCCRAARSSSFTHSLADERHAFTHTHPIHFPGNNFHFFPARYGDLRHRSTSLISARSIGRCCGDFASVRCSLSVSDGKQLVAVALRLQHRGGAARVQGGGPQGPQTAAGPRRRVRRH